MARGQKQDPLPTGPEAPDALAAGEAVAVPAVTIPSNGAHEGATALPFVVKVTGGQSAGAKAAQKPSKVDGEDALSAMASSKGAAWTVRRTSAPGYEGQPGVLGVLPVTLGASDLDAGLLAERFGLGTYEFTSGEKRYSVPIATTKPPVTFGPPQEEQQYMMAQSAAGPVAVPVQKGFPQSPYMFAPQPQPVVPQTDPTLKATLDAILALLSKKGDDDGHGKFALLLEQEKAKTAKIEADARVAVAKAEAEARAAEAKAAGEAKIAEAKESARLEQLKVEAQTKAQIEVAKAQAEAQTKAAQAQADAARENAKVMASAQEKAAEASIAAMKDRLASEKAMTDRYMDMHEKMGKDQPSLAEQIEEVMRLQSLMGGGAPGAGGWLGLAKEAGGVIAKFIETQGRLAQQAIAVQSQQQAPAQLPAPAVTATVTQQNPAPAPTPEQAKEAAEQAEKKKQLMNAFQTLRGASDGPADPAQVAKALEHTPLVRDWIRASTNEKLMADIEALMAPGVLTPGERAVVEGAKAAISRDAERLAWFQAVLAAVRT